MDRRAKPKKVKAEATRAPRPPKGDSAKAPELEKRLAEALKREAEALQQLQTRDRELAESLSQQTATADVLRIIAQSPTELQPVFDAAATAALRLCAATDVIIYLRDGDARVSAAHAGAIRARPIGDRQPLDRGSIIGRAIIDARTIHNADIDAGDPASYPYLREACYVNQGL